MLLRQRQLNLFESRLPKPIGHILMANLNHHIRMTVQNVSHNTVDANTPFQNHFLD